MGKKGRKKTGKTRREHAGICPGGRVHRDGSLQPTALRTDGTGELTGEQEPFFRVGDSEATCRQQDEKNDAADEEGSTSGNLEHEIEAGNMFGTHGIRPPERLPFARFLRKMSSRSISSRYASIYAAVS